MTCPGSRSKSYQRCLWCHACSPGMSPAIQTFLENQFLETQITFASIVNEVEAMI